MYAKSGKHGHVRYIRTVRSAYLFIALAVVGLFTILVTNAAVYVGAVEAESGTLNGAASVAMTSNTSGGKSVLFGGSIAPSGRFGLAEGGLLQHMTAAQLDATLDGYEDLGVGWVRTDIDWLRVQAGGPGSWDWSAYDTVIDAITSRDMRVVGILAYPPDWARPVGCDNNYECVPRNASEFGTFSRAAAERYAAKGVSVWEIWNEPNGGTFTPAQYATVMKAAYPAIKSAQPQSTVLAGGSMPNDTSGGGYSPIDFLQGVYANGGKPYFDALTHHPYCWGGGDAFDCPTTFADWSAWSQIEETNPSLRSVMAANGDSTKKIWLTEMGAPTSGNPAHVSEAGQAKTLTDSYALIKSKPWAGPMFWYQYKDKGSANDDSENWFGLLRRDGTPKPAYQAYRAASISQ